MRLGAVVEVDIARGRRCSTRVPQTAQDARCGPRGAAAEKELGPPSAYTYYVGGGGVLRYQHFSLMS